ncbi:hypothetical protein CNR22_01060 [Sphingobacteriaceae bacterium]|nr:hypothetical protein CNR22_01060 [Sphingobacteriaceae bacterium]
MKNLLITLLLLLSILETNLYSQTDRNSAIQNTSVDAKASYISNQSYLSASTVKDYKNFYGDSLKGFNEAAVKTELLARLYVGEEFINVMAIRKREYINQKYKLGRFAPNQQTTQTQTTPKGKTSGAGASINGAPCTNEDFESTTPGTYNTSNAVSGWVVESTSSSTCQVTCNNPAPIWVGGSPEFSIVSTPILGHPYIGNIGASPLGGTNVAVLNDVVPGFTVTRISTTFPVTTQNSLFQFAYAGSWDGSGHLCCDQPFFTINMFDCNGAALGCSSVSLTPSGPSCNSGNNGYTVTNNVSWTNWQIQYIDLTPYIGSCVTMQIVNGDCTGGAHHGSLYFDAKCGGSILCGNCSPPTTNTISIAGPVSFCSGSGVAQIAAPLGYATYSWVAPASGPTLSPAMSTMQVISISNPVANSVYTLYLTSFSGCQFVSTNTIAPSSVNIAGLASAPSCAGGASGTATVVGNGSGSGYNYTWLNSANLVVGTASIVTGLPAGIYSIVLTGLGAAGCGSAVATTTIGTAAPAVQSILKPFCGNVAPILTNGGSNFQWYSGTSAITASLGGNSPTIAIQNPVNGQTISVTYISNQGCQDSVQYILASTTPGFLMATGITSVCLNGTNGTGQINLATAQGAPSGFNYINVASSGSNTPAYNTSTSAGTATNLTLSGLAAGTYSVNAFDGACYYTSTFVVNTHVFNYTLTPSSPTLCPGNSLAASVNFGYAPGGMYTYQWSPSTWLIGTTSANSIVSPTVVPGTQATIVYTVVVTPTLINCPLVKHMTITAVNPGTPTFSVIPALCNNSSAYQILTNLPGGSFSTSFSGTASPVSAGGLITPSHTNIVFGVNTFTYSTSVYTCAASNTGTYEVSEFRTAALSAGVPALCVTSPAFNLMTIVQGTAGGSWNGTNVNANQFSPANLLSGNYTLTYSRTSSPNTLACPSNTSINVAVTNTLIPTITQVSEFCTNAAPFSLTANPAGGGWSAAMGVTNSGLVMPANITSPNLTVTYTLVDGPCLDMSSTVLQISKFIPATLTGPAPDFCYSTPAFNLMSLVLNTSGTWTAASGVATNSFFPNGLATNTYALTYNTTSVPNALLCPDSQTLFVSVLNPAQPTITPVSTLCNNVNPFQLSVSPNTGQWSTTAYLSDNGLFSPALSSIGNNLIQYSIGTPTCNRHQAMNINVEAFVPATITGNIPDLCNNSPVINLSPFTSNNLGHWTGTGISGTDFNPAVAGAGSVTLQYNTASSPSGLCPDVASIAVNVFSLAVPVVSQAGPFCNSSLPVQLNVSPIGGLFGGPITGVVSSGGLFNPAFGVIGNNLITYSVTSGPCKAYAQTIVKVEKFVSAAFEKPVGPFCNTDLAVNLNSYVQNQGGTWSTKNGAPGLLGTLFNPSIANPDNAIVLVYTTHSEPGEANCPDVAEMRVEVRKAPQVEITRSLQEGCAPLKIEFNAPGINAGKGLWNISDGSDPENGYNIEHVFSTPGNYKIQFDYADNLGCKADTKTTEIAVYASPKADFSFPEEIYISEPKVQLINLSSDLDNNLYQWKAGNVYQSSELSPVINFTAIGKYQITLTATSLKNCSSEVSKVIEVKNNYNIFIPNSFTPNFDGINDYFIPVFTKEGVDPKGFEMKIYDRWGHLVYQSNEMSKGWDGSFQNKGETLKEDSYVFKIKYKDSEGSTFEKMGNVSLLK